MELSRMTKEFQYLKAQLEQKSTIITENARDALTTSRANERLNNEIDSLNREK